MVYFSLFFHLPPFFRTQVGYSFFLLHEVLFLYNTLIIALNRHRVKDDILLFPVILNGG